jgi:hypothetical protein
MILSSSTSRVVALIAAVVSGCASSPAPPATASPGPAAGPPPQTAPPPHADLLEEKIPFGVVVEADTSNCSASLARINRAWEQASVCDRDADCEKSYGNCAAARRGAAHDALHESASAAMKACKGSLMVPVCDEETTPVCVERKCRVKRRAPPR